MNIHHPQDLGAMRRLWTALALLGFLLAFPTALGIYNRVQMGYGVRDEKILRLQGINNGLRVANDSLKNVERARVDTFVRWRTKWDTLPLLVPDLLRADAPPVPARQLANVIIIGNNTIAACSEALMTCQQRGIVQDSLIQGLTLQISLLERKIPTAFDRYLEWGFRGLAFYLGTRTGK